MRSRNTILCLTATVAILIHAALLFAGTVMPAPEADAADMPDQGIMISLAPAPRVEPPIEPPAEPPAEPPVQQQEAPPAPPEPETPPPLPKAPDLSKAEKTLPPKKPERRQAANAASETVAKAAPQPAQHPATEASARPEPLRLHNNPKPSYPDLARKRGQEGLVLIRVRVDDKGNPIDVGIEKSSGFPMLDEAALKAVRRWRFNPALQDGRAVSGSTVVPVEFRLEG